MQIQLCTISTIILLIHLLSSCSSKEVKEQKVSVRVEHFPGSINYLVSTSYLGHDIQRKTFNELLIRDESGGLKPLLVEKKPTIETLDSIKYEFKYSLRKEAKWDNGSPITCNDIMFSLKVLKLPFAKNIGIASYYSRIINVICYNNNRDFGLVLVGNKHDLIRLSGDFGILQKSKFDPNGLLDHISLNEIANNPEKVRNDSKVRQFYDAFTKDKYTFNGEYFHASGPYTITRIEQGKSITLTKNLNWWGLQLADQYDYIHANPSQITYYSIPETITAIYALRQGEIDVMDNIPSGEFVQLAQDEGFKSSFNLFSPLKYTFTYVGFNSANHFLANRKIRKAIAHLIDKEQIVASVESGYAEPTIGPINPAKSYFYNDQIEPTPYNPEVAKKLLREAGLEWKNNQWIDSSDHTPVQFTIIHKQNSIYEGIAQILTSEAQKIGLRINSLSKDDRQVRTSVKNRDFDITIGSFNGSPYSFNFSGLFSTKAAQGGGMNFTGFGNAESDSIIAAVNYAQDSIQRRHSLFALQEKLHNESTMVFLYFSKNKIAVNKKFTNLKISSLKPGYDVTAFETTEAR